MNPWSGSMQVRPTTLPCFMVINRHWLETYVLSSMLLSEWLAAPCFSQTSTWALPTTEHTSQFEWMSTTLSGAVTALCFLIFLKLKKIIPVVLEFWIYPSKSVFWKKNISSQSSQRYQVLGLSAGPGFCFIYLFLVILWEPSFSPNPQDVLQQLLLCQLFKQ